MIAMAAKKTMVGTVHPAVLEYTAGKDVTLDIGLVEVDCIGTAAHVAMLAELPVESIRFTPQERDAITAELVAIIHTSRAGKFKITAEDQDVHLAVERRLTAALGSLGKRVHTARSRNDQVALDLRLFAKGALLQLMEEICGLARVFVTLAQRYKRMPMVGRTHLQPAMPSSVALWATAHAESLLDDLELVQAAYRTNDRSPLGSAAGYGVPLPIDRQLTSDLLDFERPIHNVLYASNARGKCESVILDACAQVMSTLSRLAEDVVLYTMPEFGYFVLPREYCTGSSIMPQKSNPDVFELMRARAAKVMGCRDWSATILKGLAGGYSRDLQEAKEPFMEGLGVTLASVRTGALVLAGMTVDRAALERGFTAGVFATDKALELVADGMPFREAYAYVKENLHELEREDPYAAIDRKTHLGGTAGLDLGLYRKRIRDGLGFVRTRRRRYYGAIGKLLDISYPDLD
jgi:argininosuccinate lyase